MKSNCKEVKEKIREHIFEYFETVEDLKSQVESIKQGCYSNWSNYMVGKHLVEGAMFLIYCEEIHEFLESLKLNNNSKKTFDCIEEFEMYKHLIAREIENILK